MDRIEKLVIVLLVAIAVAISTGCSFKLEFGYHGETGRDDRVQTALTKTIKVRE